jgi:hypothetical protein
MNSHNIKPVVFGSINIQVSRNRFSKRQQRVIGDKWRLYKYLYDELCCSIGESIRNCLKHLNYVSVGMLRTASVV